MKLIVIGLIVFALAISVDSIDPFFAGFEAAFSRLIPGVTFNSLHYLRPEPKRPLTQPIAYPKVQTSSGLITGASYENGYAFYSIPYAKPPVGNLRFQEPQMALDNGPLDKSSPDYVNCYEFFVFGPLPSNKYYSENCLVLNVFVPTTIDLTAPANKKLPVMFWIHGGAFFLGSGTAISYDAQKLSQETNTVVVSINYRIGALGFVVYNKTEDTYSGGNQGMKDQRLAMKWVQENIENFGGDKSMVTIFGESAGGQSVMFHTLSEKSSPFYNSAIMHSNPAVFAYPKKRQAYKKVTEGLLKGLGCDLNSKTDLQCLQEATIQNLLDAHYNMLDQAWKNFIFYDAFFFIEPYHPVLDEDEISDQPIKLFQSGKWNKKKNAIAGTLSEEVSIFSPMLNGLKMPKIIFGMLVASAIGFGHIDDVLEKYERYASDDGDYTKSFEQAVLDLVFACPTRAMTRSMSETANLYDPSIYLYVDYHPLDGELCNHLIQNDISLQKFCGYAFHGTDLLFVFNVDEVTGGHLSQADEVLVKLFSKFWGNFAYHGTPTTSSSEWPRYVPRPQQSGESVKAWTNIRLEAPTSSIEDGYKEELCDFWDSIDAYNSLFDPTAKRDIIQDPTPKLSSNRCGN
ncbi:unnamed protein product [Clavelina lepadiformis]|uniref:Carboxylic ester hydrolase n=1 Tax=Clavelina lepadiformis TaxID=159417 RepID=A0ABP0GEJ0_CLALP